MHSLAPRILDIRALAKETVNMKELIGRLFQMDVLKGMGVTFRTQHPDNVYTEQYPLERPMVAERYRGAPRLNNHPESGETLLFLSRRHADHILDVSPKEGEASKRKIIDNR